MCKAQGMQSTFAENMTWSLTIYDLPREMAALPISWGELFIIWVE